MDIEEREARSCKVEDDGAFSKAGVEVNQMYSMRNEEVER